MGGGEGIEGIGSTRFRKRTSFVGMFGNNPINYIETEQHTGLIMICL